MTPQSYKISVVSPVLNEQSILANFITEVTAALDAINPNFEVILVDDGSSDNSFAVIAAANEKDNRIKGLRLSRRFGKEAAIQAGLQRTTGDVMVTLDSDLQHPPEIIHQLFEQWRNGAQIVHAVKNPNQRDPLWYRMCASIFYRIFSRFLRFDMRGSSDFKLLDRQVLDRYLRYYRERQRFFRGLVGQMGFTQAFVAFDVPPRIDGKSRWSLRQLASYGINAITAFTSVPLYFVPLMGFLMLFIALLLGGEALFSRLQGHAVSGFATLEITLLFVGSLVMVGLGIIGQYLAGIYEEIKQRPLFLLECEIGFQKPMRPPSANE